VKTVLSDIALRVFYVDRRLDYSDRSMRCYGNRDNNPFNCCLKFSATYHC